MNCNLPKQNYQTSLLSNLIQCLVCKQYFYRATKVERLFGTDAIVDDLKANKRKINLITDHLVHVCQIIITFIFCIVGKDIFLTREEAEKALAERIEHSD